MVFRLMLLVTCGIFTMGLHVMKPIKSLDRLRCKVLGGMQCRAYLVSFGQCIFIDLLMLVFLG